MLKVGSWIQIKFFFFFNVLILYAPRSFDAFLNIKGFGLDEIFRSSPKNLSFMFATQEVVEQGLLRMEITANL